MQKREPHDSSFVYQIVRRKVIEKIAPALKEKGDNSQLIMTILVICLAALGGIFVGFYIQTNVISPPTQETGVCIQPNFIQDNQCWTYETVYQVTSGVQTAVQTKVPGGYIITP